MNAPYLRTLGLRQSVSTLLLAGLFFVACPQGKADPVFTSRAAFNSATTGRTTVTFTGLAATGTNQANPNNLPLGGQPLTLDGATFTIPGPGSVTVGSNQYIGNPQYADGDFLFANYGTPDDIINILLPSSTAVGFDVGGAYGNPGTITVTLSDGTVEVLTNPVGYVSSGAAHPLGFLGFTSTVGITSVSIAFDPPTPGGTTFGTLDNFTFGTALPIVTPEPSSLLLLGSGMMVAAGAFRRRIFHS